MNGRVLRAANRVFCFFLCLYSSLIALKAWDLGMLSSQTETLIVSINYC